MNFALRFDAPILTALLLAPLAALHAADAPNAARTPNFLFILAADVGWGDFQCYNRQGKIPSPNIDQLAREGMRFTDAYTPPDMLLGTPVKGASKMTPHTDMVHEVDVVVRKLVEALEQRGLMESTLIVVTSDNGGIPADRKHGHDAVGGLRGSKSFIWEGGHRVPLVACWKGRVPAGTVRTQLVGAHDPAHPEQPRPGRRRATH